MKRIWLLGATGLLAAGCASIKGLHQSYDVPPVTGRVLNADTRQPVGGALVRRLETTEMSRLPRPSEKKGAELLLDGVSVWTEADGTFELKSVKSFYLLFGRDPATAVGVAIGHPGYESLRTNFPVTVPRTNLVTGVDAVQAGEFLLRPKRP